MELSLYAPFSGTTQKVHVPEGCTLRELVEFAIQEEWMRPYAHVAIGTHSFDPSVWHHVRPKAGVEVSISVVPQGGGKSGLMIVAQIAILAAAITIPGMIAAAPFAAGTWAATATGQALIGASIGIVGAALIQALAPPPEKQFDEIAKASPYLQGAGNSVRPYDPVPWVLGSMRYQPPLGARTYTEMSGDNYYLRCLFCWGMGPVQLSDFKIGTTPLASFDEIEIEHRYGLTTDPDLTLYTHSPLEDYFDTLIKHVDGWTQRVTPVDIQEIILEFFFPRGCIRVSENQKDRDDHTVTLDIRWSLEGLNDWHTFTMNITRQTLTPFRVPLRLFVARNATLGYQVQVQRATVDVAEEDQTRVPDEVHWTVVRSIRPEYPISVDGLALTAVRIRATDQLQGTLDTFNAKVQSLCRDWDEPSGFWVPDQPTRNPASIFRYLLQGRGNARPVFNSRIDLEALQSWHHYCAFRKLEFNHVIDYRLSVFDALKLVCAVGNASLRLSYGKWGVSIDDRKSVAVQLLTPANTRNFTWSQQFVEHPHALRVSFQNKIVDNERDEIVVYNDGYKASNATKFETLDLPGVDNAAQAHMLARRVMASAKLRPVKYNCEQPIEYLLSQPGDLVLSSHDIMFWGIGFGRVSDLTIVSGNVTQVTMDNSVPLGAANYVLRRRKGSNTGVLDYPITNQNAPFVSTFTLVDPVAAVDAPQLGDLIAIDELNNDPTRLIVKSIEPVDNETARLTLVDEGPGIWSSDDELIPDYDANITLPAGVASPVITFVRSDEDVLPLSSDGTFKDAIVVYLYYDSNRPLDKIDYVNVQYRRTGTTEAWKGTNQKSDARQIYLLDVDKGATYDVRACYVFADSKGRRTLSDWAGPVSHKVIGASTPPPTPGPAYEDGNLIRWDPNPQAKDHAGWKVKATANFGAGWNGAQTVHEGILTTAQIDRSRIPTGSTDIFVKAVDKTGLESDGSSHIGLTFLSSSSTSTYTLKIDDHSDLGFPGTIINGIVVPDDVGSGLLATGSSGYLPDSNVPYLPDNAAPYLVGDFDPMRYEADFIIPSDARSSDEITVEYGGIGVDLLEARYVRDVIQDASDDDPFLPIDSDLFLPNNLLPFLSTIAVDPTRPWFSWRNVTIPIPGEVLRVAIITQGGPIQGTINTFRVMLRASEVTDTTHGDIDLPVGGARIPPGTWAGRKQLRRLVWVRYTMVDGSDATRIVRKNPDQVVDAAQGPLMIGYDGVTSLSAQAEFTFGGY
jgi:hypothetical protein